MGPRDYRFETPDRQFVSRPGKLQPLADFEQHRVQLIAAALDPDPATQEIQLYDVVQLAHFYRVSVPSTLFRLRNLKLVSESEFERLRTMDGEGRSKKIASALGLETDESLEQRGEFQRRFLALGLEALRREKISQAKFLQLAGRAGVRHWIAKDLVVTAGIDDAEAQSVLLPE